MGGVGKWIKKHPLETVGLLAGGVMGGPAIAGLFSGTGAATGAAIAPELAGGLGAGAADEMLSAVPATMGDKFGTFAGNLGLGLDNMAPYAKFAGQAQGLLSPEPQPMPQMQPRPQQVAQAPSAGMLPYGDPLAEEEKRRRLAATGRFYG